ncbi:hypothetical protein [Pseudonocardia pini]|uniref:hypothetical protein n=1 Tax=Pseudonocardia pini TaxID=2758030 RepID=UPI0015EFFB13|nr:hypothetical protein [Pseudonocardia pini]
MTADKPSPRARHAAEDDAPAVCKIEGCTKTGQQEIGESIGLTRGLCPAHWASRRGDADPKLEEVASSE